VVVVIGMNGNVIVESCIFMYSGSTSDGGGVYLIVIESWITFVKGCKCISYSSKGKRGGL
jgi:hypothetical protein